MSTPIFLNEEQILSLLLSELPEGTYAEDRANDPDPNKRSVSSSELRAVARVLAQVYQNLRDINSDKFITTVTTDGLRSWERQLFTEAQDSTQSYNQRQANLFSKIRASGGISFFVINALIGGLLTPLGLTFQLVTLCGVNGGGWVLDKSKLDIDTYLALRDPLWGTQRDFTPLDCDHDYAAAGITLQDMLDIETTAYTYVVRIFGAANSDTLTRLELMLTQFEPARSTHKIYNNFPTPPPPGIVGGGGFVGSVFYAIIDGGLFVAPSGFDVIDGGGF